ncbi:MAG: hypothetical protein KF773_30720 [Deltaproteobacteria bacterium]|nr:hypothetical protein [Deltaproteobacteria bacterium]MCW5807148.1 hypothetical protein [Deltaproteobacteria bacterium]
MTLAEAGVHDRVRGEITSLLGKSQAYRDLPEGQRAQLLADMTKVGAYLASPVAGGLADKGPSPGDLLKMNAAKDPGLVQDQFKASAVREGVDAFRDMVKAVDFPKFVSSLVQGVFRAIVDASIQQMQAYAELLSAASKTVDQFAGDSISDGMARDFIANQNPKAVRIDTSGEGARLRANGEDAAGLGKNFGIDDVDLDDDEGEARLVLAAKQQMARSKQQMLATMVLMGINRIVITNGNINAKVVFDMRASDEAKRRRKAQMSDKEKDHEESQTGWFTNLVGGYDVSHDHETTVQSSVDETSESKAAVKAQLTGDVRLAFKSETFPLERMVDLIGMQNLQQKAQPVAPPGRPAAPAPAPAPAPTPGAPR